jgi:hypothetical protein
VRNNLKMGIVGLPNVGKSSLFNLLCEQSCAAVRNAAPPLAQRAAAGVLFGGVLRHSLSLTAALPAPPGCAGELCVRLRRRGAQRAAQERSRCRTCPRRAPRSLWGASDTLTHPHTTPPPCARADPFCTIEPNESRCAVSDERYDWLCSARPAAAFAASRVRAHLVAFVQR